jgi:hypothetical protein
MEVDNAISKEIRRLMLLIALARHDFEEATKQRMPASFTSLIAQELADYEFQRKCLETKNFKALPYNINLLYNSEKP